VGGAWAGTLSRDWSTRDGQLVTANTDVWLCLRSVVSDVQVVQDSEEPDLTLESQDVDSAI